MADRSVSVSMTLSDLERRDVKGQIFSVFLRGQPRPYIKGAVPHHSTISGFPSICAYTLWHITTKFMWQHVEIGFFFGVNRAPTPRRWGPSALHFMGFLSIYAYTLCRWTTKFDVVTHMGRGLFSGGQPRTTQRWQGPSTPQCLRFPSVYVYAVCFKNTKFDIRGGGSF